MPHCVLLRSRHAGAVPKSVAATHRARSAGVGSARAACVVGLLYALLSAYWGLGGTRFLDTIGGTLEREGRARTGLIVAVLWLSVILKLLAAAVGLLAAGPQPRTRLRRLARRTAWAAAGVLTLYGCLLTAVGLLVQADVLSASADADHRALRWHAYLWDPWFLLWGVLLGIALARSRPRRGR